MEAHAVRREKLPLRHVLKGNVLFSETDAVEL